jgi:hypothetical protein
MWGVPLLYSENRYFFPLRVDPVPPLILLFIIRSLEPMLCILYDILEQRVSKFVALFRR